MTALDASDMSRLRSDTESLLQLTGTIVRPRIVDDGHGGTMPDPAGPERSSVQYAIAAKSGRELFVTTAPGMAGGQYGQQGTHELRVPATTDIRQTDQFETAEGGRYQVVFVPAVRWPALLRVVDVEELP